jgi:hypothetical protein
VTDVGDWPEQRQFSAYTQLSIRHGFQDDLSLALGASENGESPPQSYTFFLRPAQISGSRTPIHEGKRNCELSVFLESLPLYLRLGWEVG